MYLNFKNNGTSNKFLHTDTQQRLLGPATPTITKSGCQSTRKNKYRNSGTKKVKCLKSFNSENARLSEVITIYEKLTKSRGDKGDDYLFQFELNTPPLRNNELNFLSLLC